MPEAVRRADDGWYYVANELISLVDQTGGGHVPMVAKELDATNRSGIADAPYVANGTVLGGRLLTCVASLGSLQSERALDLVRPRLVNEMQRFAGGAHPEG